jgi:peptidoglycan/xylan/chitin deacetylase (PgdA/CDA1 family)
MELRKAGQGERSPPSKRRIVTASFDDGHPLDLKVAERLAQRGMRATFYIAWNHPKGPEISAPDIKALRKMGMEIGSHTWSHQLLTGRPRSEVMEELTKSKKALEDLLGEPIVGFSYPEGRFDRMIRDAAGEAGYEFARTTLAYRSGLAFDPLRMPVTVILLPLTPYEHFRHAVRDGNLVGLARWWRVTRAERDLFRGSQLFFDAVLQKGGVFHLYSRSWQIEQLAMWETFDHILDHVARWDEVLYVPNSGALS